MTALAEDPNMRLAWAAHGFHGEPDALIANGTIIDAWLKRVESNPDSSAFTTNGSSQGISGDANARDITHGELAAQTAAAAQWFMHAGLAHGDRILMSCEPSVDLIIAHVAALRAGLVVVPVNTAFTNVELANIATESEARLLVLSDPARYGGPIATIQPTAISNGAISQDVHSTNAPLPKLSADDPALLIFTSGTTGKPKGALLSHCNILASVEALRHAWQWTASDRLVLALPLFHMHGLGVGVHGTLVCGASAVIIPKFTPDAVFDAASGPEHAQRATMLFGVPTMWVRIVEHSRVGELQALRLCVSGSAALSPDVWHGLRERGGQEIIERYGMSETVMNISNPFVGERRPGSVGLPLPGVEVRLLDRGADGVGEIGLRGPNVFSGYWNRPEANTDAFTNDGWFRTGDLGRIDPDGYVSIVGRSKDLIITGGYNVYPRDIEEVLRTHPSIVDAAVIGEPSAEWGETVTACVIGKQSTLDVDDVLAFASQHLAPYQKPRRVVVVYEFPRNALGKVVKAELAKQVVQ